MIQKQAEQEGIKLLQTVLGARLIAEDMLQVQTCCTL